MLSGQCLQRWKTTLSKRYPSDFPFNGDAARAERAVVRARKGLTESERSYLRWLERGETRLLPGLVTDYLTHKLVSLLVRNSKPVHPQLLRP